MRKELWKRSHRHKRLEKGGEIPWEEEKICERTRVFGECELSDSSRGGGEGVHGPGGADRAVQCDPRDPSIAALGCAAARPLEETPERFQAGDRRRLEPRWYADRVAARRRAGAARAEKLEAA
ncbi:hypothetical protein NDU88_005360 [Pleurodeles waltl]|uniref:Uncharacterized protein n=1 Tax=Pleurodeles waltl TaxID=8319 RepID=A0AAV7X0F8_PLEWA|nr:hypothetical protein NDU88_005360 [Pleurodeles waltl]